MLSLRARIPMRGVLKEVISQIGFFEDGLSGVGNRNRRNRAVEDEGCESDGNREFGGSRDGGQRENRQLAPELVPFWQLF